MEGAVRSGLNAVIALHDTLARGPKPAVVTGALPGNEGGVDAAKTGTIDNPPELAQSAASEVSNAEVNMDANEREVRS
jgi:hypothetical protein